jgi:serine/threonine protein kinase
MSPEQAKDAGLDGRSDLYSLGLMLYEMLTGAHPRRGLSNTAVLGMLANEAASPVLSFSPSVPVGVQAIVKSLLCYRPIDRIKDAHQLVDQLESLQTEGRPVLRSAPRPNAMVDDRTICELEEPIQNLGSSISKEGLRRSGEGQSRTPWIRIAAIAFASLATIALGIVGLNSFVSSPSPSVKEIKLAPREAQERLEHLRQSVTAKDLAEIDKISVMSENRRSWLESLFRNYSTIEASLGQVDTTSTEISTVLRIDKLILPNGEAFPIGPALQKVRLTVTREGDGWGKIRW